MPTDGINDLKERLGNILVSIPTTGARKYARDLKVGAMAVLLKDAIKPNLVQTFEASLFSAWIPFANIAHGNNSVMATMTARLADYV